MSRFKKIVAGLEPELLKSEILETSIFLYELPDKFQALKLGLQALLRKLFHSGESQIHQRCELYRKISIPRFWATRMCNLVGIREGVNTVNSNYPCSSFFFITECGIVVLGGRLRVVPRGYMLLIPYIMESLVGEGLVPVSTASHRAVGVGCNSLRLILNQPSCF